MQTLKTTVVVLLLLVVFYGMYEMLNQPPDEPPAEVAQMDELAFEPPEIEFGATTEDVGIPADAPGSPSAVRVVPTDATSANRTVSPATDAFPSIPPADPNTVDSNASTVALPQPNNPSTHRVTGPVGPPNPDMSTFVPPGDRRNLAAERSRGVATNEASGFVPPGSSETGPPRAPGSPQMQSNPYIGQDVVAESRPTVSSSGSPPPNGDAIDPAATLGNQAYQSARRTAQRQMKEGKLREALVTLSPFYKSLDLSAAEHRELLDLLDPLAAQVIYSREHLVEAPYRVGRNETLDEIAQKYQVPPQLLQKINGVEDPRVLLPGAELKVVRGPFRGDVDIAASELTLFLDEMYAGRFPITVGSDPAPIEGTFEVRDKQSNRAYFGPTGITIPAGNPTNPYGNVWLDLGKEICIHGSPLDGTAAANRGCISLSPRDADDVFSILSVGSRVRILR